MNAFETQDYVREHWFQTIAGLHRQCADELAATVAGMRGRTCATCRHGEKDDPQHPSYPITFYCHHHAIESAMHVRVPDGFGCNLHQPTPPEPVKGDEK